MESQSDNPEIENEIKIETPSPIQEAIPNQNENNNLNENSNENNILLRPKKVILNKNANNDVNKNQNNNDLLSEDNLDHPKPLSSDYYDEEKGDIRKLFDQKKIKKPNRIKRINKLEGYLDDDLDDDENKKIYLRVIKRLEKTFGIPVIGVKLPGESINNIEIEENIRPIIFNEYNKVRNTNKFNRVGISVNDKKFIIKSNIEKNKNQNEINNNLNNKKKYDNQIVKINEGNILNNIYDNIIFDNNVKKPEDIGKKIIKTIYNKNQNQQKQNKKINNTIIRENLSLIKNKYMNIFGNSNKNENKQKFNKLINNRQNIQNSNKKYNNNPKNTNTKNELQKFHYSNSKTNINTSTNKERILISTGSYSKLNTPYNLKKNLNLPSRKISYENSGQNQETKQKTTQNLINSIKIGEQNKNQSKNYQIINQISNSNKEEKKPIKNIKNLKNQNISNISKNNQTKHYNTNIIPDIQRGTNICVKENESELKSGKIKTQTYIRDDQFNNVQTTYVIYSKKDKKNNLGIKKGNNTIKDSDKNNNNNKIEKKLIKNTAEIFSRTPEKKHFIERPISRKNQELLNTHNRNKKINENDKNDINKKDKFNPFNSPERNSKKNVNRINSNQSAENPKKTQNFIANNRNSIDNNYKISNFTTIKTSINKTGRFQDFNREENSTFKRYRQKRNDYKLDSKEDKKLFGNTYIIQSTNNGK